MSPDDQEIGRLLCHDLQDPGGRRPLLEAHSDLQSRARHAAEQAIEPLLRSTARVLEELFIEIGWEVALGGKDEWWRGHVQKQDLGAEQPPEPPGLVPGRLRHGGKVRRVDDSADCSHGPPHHRP